MKVAKQLTLQILHFYEHISIYTLDDNAVFKNSTRLYLAFHRYLPQKATWVSAKFSSFPVNIPEVNGN